MQVEHTFGSGAGRAVKGTDHVINEAERVIRASGRVILIAAKDLWAAGNVGSFAAIRRAGITCRILKYRLELLIAVSCLAVVLLPEPARAALPPPRLKWSTKLDLRLDASPIAYPAERPDSVVLACGGHVVRLGGRGNVVFQNSFGPEAGRGGVFEATAADLDGDGREELIVGHKAGFVCAVAADNGRMLWQYDLGGALDTWEMAVTAELDGDGHPEVLASSQNGWIVCLDQQGRLRWRSRVETWRVSTPCVGDINNDGRPEIVYGTATRHLVAMDAAGRILWDSFQPPLFLDRTMPLLADLDGDSRAEIYSLSSMIAPDTGLVSLNGVDGSLRWTGAKYSKAYMGRTILPLGDGTMGILVGDKGNNLCAYQADGRQRWRIRVDGRGVWSPPVVADLDGDGKPEIVTGVRAGGWSVLGVDGKLLGTYDVQGGHFGSSLVADIDGDQVLEVVNAASSGQVSAYTFGGPARAGAVISGDWRGPSYPLRKGVAPSETPPQPAAMTLAEELPELHYGDNPLRVKLPACLNRSLVELATTAPDGSREIRGFRVEPGCTSAEVVWPVWVPGRYELAIRLLDLDRHTALGAQTISREVPDPAAGFRSAQEAVRKVLRETGKRLAGCARCAVMMARLEAELQIKCDLLTARIRAAASLSITHRDALARDATGFLADLARIASLAALIEKAQSEGRGAPFVLWQDANPWDNRNPLDELPGDVRRPVIRAWAFGNEIESVCASIVNLSPEPLTLRVEPGTISRAGQKLAKPAISELAQWHRVVRLPSVHGEVVPDLLPKLADSLIDVAPGQVQQIWINLRTAPLQPGTYELTWPVRCLDAESATRNLSIELQVSPVALPEKSRFLAGFWSRNELAGIDAVPDLNEHLQTLWYGVPLPSARADAHGNLVGPIDWTSHDAVISRAKQVMKILYGGEPPTPTFPEGMAVTEELRRTAQRNYFGALAEHLKQFGLDHTAAMFYVEDETGLTGTHENYLRGARRNKAIDPRVQNYANPWEGITVAMAREMEPLTDVWQPGMETIEFLGPEYVAAMRGASHKPIATYTPPGNCRILRPLGFYRSQPWLAWHWGIEGGGWWVYSGADLWATHPDREPGYGAVVSDGRSLVASRRWEATRDGIEDFNALVLLDRCAKAKNDQEALAVIREAVAYVVGRALTGTPREATDYELDYATFMQHRARIREALERLQSVEPKP